MMAVDVQLKYKNKCCMWNCGKYPESGYFEDWGGDCDDYTFTASYRKFIFSEISVAILALWFAGRLNT